MTPELIKLEQAIIKKIRPGKRLLCSAPKKEIRKCFAEYKKSLDKSWWERWREKVGLK